MQVSVLAMQNAKHIFVIKNLWPRRRFESMIAILPMPANMKRPRNTAVIGTSREGVGIPPKDAVEGGYGGPGGP